MFACSSHPVFHRFWAVLVRIPCSFRINLAFIISIVSSTCVVLFPRRPWHRDLVRLHSHFLLFHLTVSRYFSAIFSASKNFPKYSGLAAGGTMALFGLSPLILSFFASTWFTDAQGGLNVSGFTAFLAILTGVVHIFGAINMTVEVQPIQDPLSASPTIEGPPEDADANSETTPLLPTKSDFQTYDRVWNVLRDYHFWVLALVILLTLGSVRQIFSCTLLVWLIWVAV
jgi:hypothetical protein